MSEQLELLPGYLLGHLELTLVALALGVALSVPLGVLASRVRWLERVVMGLAGIVQTIPALALLAVMVPILAALTLPSIGYPPALIGLTLYSMLPILRNTVTGLEGVDPACLEAARGVGMTPGEQLRRVELPLAMPVIVAGIRTATVWVVGVATLSTPVGAPSLGNYIFSGLQTRNYTAVLIGCVAAAVLALLLDAVVRLLELGLRERRRGPVVASLFVLGLLATWTAAGALGRFFSGGPRPIAIGCKTFTEQYILSQALADEVGHVSALPTRVVSSLGSTVAFDALRSGDLDLYVDYSGTIWATIMKREQVPDRATVLAEVGRYLREEHGITLLCALGFENAYALAMRGADATTLGIRRISELTPHAPRLSIGGDYEFFSRPEWKALESTYGLRFQAQRSMDSSLMYQAVAQGSVDVISAFSTDGRIKALDLRVLEDDRGAIPPYDAVLLASGRLRREHPELIVALARLAGSIDADHMRALNLEVDEEGKTPARVGADLARSWR